MTATAPTADVFGQRLAERRRAAGLSQQELADRFGTSPSTIGKYERGQMKPSIEAAAGLARALETTVGYLLGEVPADGPLSDPGMMRRLNDIDALPARERETLLATVDHFIRGVKVNAL